MTQKSIIKVVLLDALDQNGGEICGTEYLATMINVLNSKTWMLRQARKLQRDGEITIIRSNGGRTRRTIYKRNRNQPGNPRRRRG